jgi:tripartite-type tricarboxylate transporter receptor subunit TctC
MMMAVTTHRRSSLFVLAAACLALCGYAAGAAIAGDASVAYPSKPVRWIVPLPVGGSVDIIARVVGQKLYDRWHQQVIVDNRLGAGARIGTEIAANSAPDGYTHLLTLNTTLTIEPLLAAKRLPYDPEKSFAPITVVAATSQLLVANVALPVKNVQELVAYAKARPGQLNYGSSGAGGSLHLSMELFKSMTGTDMVHIPYRGGPLAVTDVLSGQLAVMFFNTPAALPFVKSGKLRALGVSSAKRSPLLPNVPTIAEQGVPEFETEVWFGLLAPAGTPSSIVNKVQRDVVAMINLPEIRTQLIGIGADPVGNSPDGFVRMMRSEIGRWAKLAKTANLRAD